MGGNELWGRQARQAGSDLGLFSISHRVFTINARTVAGRNGEAGEDSAAKGRVAHGHGQFVRARSLP